MSDGPGRKSCCGGKRDSACRATNAGKGTECGVAGCHCTPVWLQAAASPTLKKVCLPESTQFEPATFPIAVVRLPSLTQFDRAALRVDRRVPDDILVLCGRWLI